MSGNFIQSETLRSLGMAGYRGWARMQFWRTGPRILVNSIPKAGTHLLTSELARIDGLQNSRLHLLNTDIVTDRRDSSTDPEMDIARIERQLATVRAGQYFSAHLPWSAPFEEILATREIATVFVLRDPRDVLASRYHYIMGLKRHRLHGFLANPALSENERYRLLVEGNPGEPFLRPMAEMLEQFAPWVESARTLTIRFEELVGARGGGSDDEKRAAFQRIAAHCGIEEDRLPADITAPPAKTATLRKGKAGTWREELPRDIQELVELRCGAALRRLGYD